MSATHTIRSAAALRFARGLAGFLLLAVTGCAASRAPQERLPTYRWTNASDALATLRHRAESVRTVSAQCLITLTRPNGESVRLDGALVMEPQEGNVRLRAWKLDQPVIDLTLNRGGLWIEAPRQDKRRQQMLPANLNAAQAARALSLFGGGLFEGRDARVIDAGGARFEIRKRLATGQTVRAAVDRSTLVVRKYQLFDPAGAERFSMTLSDYKYLGDVPWPTRLVATSAGGTIVIELPDVEINAGIPGRAFDPPPRAEKVQ